MGRQVSRGDTRACDLRGCMIFTETKLPGVFIIDIEPISDERGFFARTFCAKEFAAMGLETNFVQHSISYNKIRGALRGMHYQAAPHEEVKIVSCVKGAIYDVVIDLRPASTTFMQWVAVELTEQNHRRLYIPKGCAHGFQTLEDDTHVSYKISEFYHPECARGVRWDDPTFRIQWPFQPSVVSVKDTRYPLYADRPRTKVWSNSDCP